MHSSSLAYTEAVPWLKDDDDYKALSIQASIVVKGNLNRDILQLAIESAVKRHEILRTNFKDVPGFNLPLQVINSENTSYYQEFNLSQLDVPAQQQKCQ